MLDSDSARAYVRTEHSDVVAAIEACADAVAESWAGETTDDASLVADRMEACLSEHGVLDALPDVLVGAVEAAGGEIQAAPVAAPPYVVVTSRGPLLRATLPGGRLVVRFEAFCVTDDGCYERAPTGPTVAVAVR